MEMKCMGMWKQRKTVGDRHYSMACVLSLLSWIEIFIDSSKMNEWKKSFSSSLPHIIMIIINIIIHQLQLQTYTYQSRVWMGPTIPYSIPSTFLTTSFFMVVFVGSSISTFIIYYWLDTGLIAEYIICQPLPPPTQGLWLTHKAWDLY